MSELLNEFFTKLAVRIYKEPCVSDILWAAMEASSELFDILTEVINIPIGGPCKIEREYYDEQTGCRPDFLITPASETPIIIEIKINDRNYHYEEYSKIQIDNVKPKIVLISSHQPIVQLPDWNIVLWNNVIDKMELSDNELIIGLTKYFRRATMSEKLMPVSFKLPIDILYLNRQIKSTIQKYQSQKCSTEIYNRISGFSENYSGYYYSLKQADYKELNIWLFFGLIYYEEEQGIGIWVEEDWTDNYYKILSLLKEHYNEGLEVDEGNGCQILIAGKEFDKFTSLQSVDEQIATLESFHNEFLGVIEQTF